MDELITLNSKDNVAMTLKELKAGETVFYRLIEDEFRINLISDICYGHKIAIKLIKKGEPVIKYGEVIGIATSDIKVGDHVHIHNVVGNRANSYEL